MAMSFQRAFSKNQSSLLVLHLKVCTFIRHKNRSLNFMCEVEWRFLRSTCDSNTSGVLIGSCQPFLSLTDFLLILFCFSYSVNMCLIKLFSVCAFGKKEIGNCRNTSQNIIIVMKSYMETLLCESRCHFYFHFFTTQCFAASLGCATQLTKKTTTREE